VPVENTGIIRIKWAVAKIGTLKHVQRIQTSIDQRTLRPSGWLSSCGQPVIASNWCSARALTGLYQQLRAVASGRRFHGRKGSGRAMSSVVPAPS